MICILPSDENVDDTRWVDGKKARTRNYMLFFFMGVSAFLS